MDHCRQIPAHSHSSCSPIFKSELNRHLSPGSSGLNVCTCHTGACLESKMNPVGIYLFKFNNGNTRTVYDYLFNNGNTRTVCDYLFNVNSTPEKRQLQCSGVFIAIFIVIVNDL